MAINEYQLFAMLHDGADTIQAEDDVEVEMFRNVLGSTSVSVVERDSASAFPRYFIFTDDGFIEASGENVREDLISCGNAFLPVRSFISRVKDVSGGEEDEE